MTTQSSSGSRLLQMILIIAVVALAFALWLQRADLSKARVENERLERLGERTLPGPGREDGHGAPVAPAQPPEPGRVSPAGGTNPVDQAAGAQASESNMVLTPAGMAPAPRSSGLVLAGTRVTPAADGLLATMQFTPVAPATEPLGIVAVVVRLPKDSPGRILDLGPSGAARFEGVMKRVSDDGKFAVFQGTAAEAAAFEFNLAVSCADVADVRGTCGIGPFALTIGPDGASASPK